MTTTEICKRCGKCNHLSGIADSIEVIPMDCPNQFRQYESDRFAQLKNEIDVKKIGDRHGIIQHLQNEIAQFEKSQTNLFAIKREKSVECWEWGFYTFAFWSTQNALNLLKDELQKLQTPTPPPAAAPQQKKEPQRHYNSGFPIDKLTAIFEKLKEGRFFDDRARLDMWLYVCGVADLNNEFEPLNWVADKQLLGVLVTKLFENDKRQYWKVAQQVFIVGGDTITKEVADGMKNSVSKIGNDWRNAPPQADQLLKIIAG